MNDFLYQTVDSSLLVTRYIGSVRLHVIYNYYIIIDNRHNHNSILLYNASTWDLTKDDERNMNSFHWRQLRIILGIKWPNKISNKKRKDKHQANIDWNNTNRKKMVMSFENRSNKKFSGRKRATIVTTINRDIKRTPVLIANYYYARFWKSVVLLMISNIFVR